MRRRPTAVAVEATSLTALLDGQVHHVLDGLLFGVEFLEDGDDRLY